MERFEIFGFVEFTAYISVGEMPVRGWERVRVMCDSFVCIYFLFFFFSFFTCCVAGLYNHKTHCEVNLPVNVIDVFTLLY